MTKSPATTPIPVQLSGPEFIAFIFPHLSMPVRGPKSRESQALLGAAMHRLSLGDVAASRRLLRLALSLHTTPPIQALWRLVAPPDESDAPPQRAKHA